MAHPAPHPAILCSFPDADSIVESLAAFVVQAQKESIEKKGRFTVALSGGSLPKMLRGLIGNPAVKWDKWFVLSVSSVKRLQCIDTQARLLRRRACCPA